MHPVKGRAAIREAWALHGVRDFVLDSEAELQKILEVIGACENAARPGLFVRLALPAAQAAIDLSSKFGASIEAAVALLQAARPVAGRLGVAFHVGSQCMDPLAWREAMALAGLAIRRAGVTVDVIDVGGGFPVAYPDLTPPPLNAFMAEIATSFEQLGLPGANTLGRARPRSGGRRRVRGGAGAAAQGQHAVCE